MTSFGSPLLANPARRGRSVSQARGLGIGRLGGFGDVFEFMIDGAADPGGDGSVGGVADPGERVGRKPDGNELGELRRRAGP
jgi:hypothetical protein